VHEISYYTPLSFSFASPNFQHLIDTTGCQMLSTSVGTLRTSTRHSPDFVHSSRAQRQSASARQRALWRDGPTRGPTRGCFCRRRTTPDACRWRGTRADAPSSRDPPTRVHNSSRHASAARALTKMPTHAPDAVSHRHILLSLEPDVRQNQQCDGSSTPRVAIRYPRPVRHQAARAATADRHDNSQRSQSH
jgi:hypothetical protein